MRKSRRAFTLVEMLVVITIIVVLMSILMPAIAGARSHARSVQCQSNLRQVMLATFQYTMHNDGQLPPHRGESGKWTRVTLGNDFDAVLVDRPRWPTILAEYWGGTFDLDHYRAISQATGSTDDQFVVVNNPILICPDAPERTTIRNLGYGYNYQFLGMARPKYFDNPSTLPGMEFANFPVGLSGIAASHMTVAYADALGSAGEWAARDRLPYAGAERLINAVGNHGYTLDPPRSFTRDGVNFNNAHYGPSECTANSRMSPAEARHGGRVNVVFLDGHVGSMTLDALGYSVNLDGSFNRNGVTNKYFSGIGADRNPPPCDPRRN